MKRSTSKNKKGLQKPTVYALFAGAGGLHLGMEKAGFEVLLATDIEPSAKVTHNKNWSRIPFLCKDIQKITSKELLKLAGGKKPDVIIGGPPCQGFSTIGDKLSSDPRNRLFESYARLVSELNPKVVVIENVKSITTMYGGKFKDHIIETFEKHGYRMHLKILNAADYGVPQIRQRAVFIGTRLEKPYMFPKETHGPDGLKDYETVGNAISDLVSKTKDDINNHSPLNHSEVVVERYKLIPEGGRLPNPDKLPKKIRRKNFGNTYKRLHRKEPSLTMVPGNNAFPIHPTLDRSLTPREAARLQSFPDKFIFVGDRRRQCILVGNAVPPLLAKNIGKSVKDHLLGRVKEKDSDEPVSMRYKKMKVFSNDYFETSDGFIDLFSGAGGFLTGFENAGWKPLLATDYDKDVAETHYANHSHVPFIHGDISDKDIKNEIINRFSGKEVGVIIGGPPCQGFSIFGKRRFVNTKGHNITKDSRNQLVYSFLEIVDEIRPKWFLMENVPGLASANDGKVLKSLIDGFINIGYKNVEKP